MSSRKKTSKKQRKPVSLASSSVLNEKELKQTDAELAAKFGHTEMRIRQARFAIGLFRSPPPVPVTEAETATALRLLNKGVAAKAIARAMNRSFHLIARIRDANEIAFHPNFRPNAEEKTWINKQLKKEKLPAAYDVE